MGTKQEILSSLEHFLFQAKLFAAISEQGTNNVMLFLDKPLHGIVKADIEKVAAKLGLILTKAKTANSYELKPKKGSQEIAVIWVSKG